MLAARIDALPADARAVLRDAAVVGDTAGRRAGGAAQAGRGGRGRPPWSRSSSSGPSTSCCTAGCCAACVAGTRSRRRCCARPPTRASARRIWPTGTPSWPGGRPAGRRRGRPGRLHRRARRAGRVLADAVRLRPDAAPGRSPRSGWPRWPGSPSGPGRRRTGAGRADTERAAPLGWRVALCATGSSTRGRCCSSAGRPRRWRTRRRSSPTPPRTRSGPARCCCAGRGLPALGDRAGERAWQEALDGGDRGRPAGERAEALRRLGMADYLSGRLTEAGEPLRGGVPDRRGRR